MNLNGVELTTELMEKLHDVESLEELKAVVKEAGIDIPAEKLAEYFDEEMEAFIMPEEDLDQVAGGGHGINPEYARKFLELNSREQDRIKQLI